MIYPKAIAEVIRDRAPHLSAHLPELADWSSNLTSRRSSSDSTAVEDWILNDGRTFGPVRAYLDFLRGIHLRLAHVGETMGYWNEQSSHQLRHDQWSVGHAGSNIMPMAAYAYYLRSYGANGIVLECGTFKGSSTACLSWVCDALDLDLVTADSFEGLPANEGHYHRGDFKGTLPEVQKNIEIVGCPGRVRYLKGWYSESLSGFSDDILILWVDVDLQQSAIDIMENVSGKLRKDSIIFSDGIVAGVDLSDEMLIPNGGEGAGFYRFFERHGIPYKAVPAGPEGMALIYPNCPTALSPVYDASKLFYLIENLDTAQT